MKQLSVVASRQLEIYIKTGKEPTLKTEIFKIGKDLLDRHRRTFELLAERLVKNGSVAKESLVEVMKQVGTVNRGREIASFVFAILVSTMFELDFDVREILRRFAVV